MERWKDLQPPPTSVSFAEQPMPGFFGGSVLDPSQLQRVGINDLALIQRQLLQHQTGVFPSSVTQERNFHPAPQQASLHNQGIIRPQQTQYITPTLTTTTTPTVNFSPSLSGSATTSPTTSRFQDDPSFTPAITLPGAPISNIKKQKLAHAPPPVSISPIAPAAPAPTIPIIQPAPAQLSLTREHTLKLAEKAMDDVSTLIKFLAANEPQLLALSNLTAAHHLISRFIAGIQKTKHTSGGLPPSQPLHQPPTIAAPHAGYVDNPQQLQQPQPPASVVHMIPHPTSSLHHSPVHPLMFSHVQHPHYPHTLAGASPPAAAIPAVSSSIPLQQSTASTITSSSGGVAAPTVRESEPLPDGIALSDFSVLDVLGTGTFGKVRLCMFKPTGRYYCMKILSKEKIVRLKQEEHILNEKSVLQSAQNPFIIRLYKTFQDRSCLYFLMEYASGGELFTCIRRASRLSNTTAKFYAAEIILAISYLHNKNIVHRDLKPENLLLDAQGHIKLTDFGFAKLVTDRTYTMCGTPEYIAPEVILSKGHGKGADWWSLGVLIYEMLAGHPPFYGDSNHTVFEKILSNRPIFPSHFDTLAKDIIDRLLVVDVEKRLGCGPDGVDEIKRHPWFRGTSWEAILQRQVPGPINPRTTAENDTRNFAKYGDVIEETPEFRGDNDIFKNF